MRNQTESNAFNINNNNLNMNNIMNNSMSNFNMTNINNMIEKVDNRNINLKTDLKIE